MTGRILPREDGFTLIEALASLAILGMVSAMLVAGVGGGRRVWERLEQTAATGESVEMAQSVLRDRLERAYPATRYDASAPYVDFEGQTSQAVFLGPASAAADSPIVRQTLTLSPAGELILTHEGSRTRLLTGVRSLDIAYFGPWSLDPRPGWRTRWESLPEPPRLVRVRLTFQPDDRRVWPELLVRPAADIGAACLLNRATGRCRGAL